MFSRLLLGAALLSSFAAAQLLNTTTALSSSLNPSVTGQSVTLKASVTPATNPNVTGNVTFKDGAVTLNTVAIAPGTGAATYTTTTFSAGSHSLTAVYNGDGSHNASPASPVLIQDVHDITTTSLTASPASPGVFGATTLLTATVGSPGPATGKVTFYSGITTLGSVTLSAKGTASLATIGVPAGANNLTARYGGDTSNLPSVSSALARTVNAKPADVSRAFTSAPLGNGNTGSFGTASGDFNGDGKADVAVAVGGAGGVEILLGNGDGTFQAPVFYPASGGVTAIAVADFNEDGIQDLVVADSGGDPGRFWILLGNGNGTFQIPVSYSTGAFAGSYSVTVADFNRDGAPDVAVALSNGTAIVFLGAGDGTFPGVNIVSIGPAAFGIAAGDFNGDGIPDLVNANASYVGILLGAGDGTFLRESRLTDSHGPLGVAIGDLNGDGVADLVVSNNTALVVTVFLGNGNGTFAAGVEYPSLGTALSLALGDVNGDGKTDIVYPDQSCCGFEVLVFAGNGNGTFQPYTRYQGDAAPLAVAVADFNGDGRTDIAVSLASTSLGLLPGRRLIFSDNFNGAASVSWINEAGNWSSNGSVYNPAAGNSNPNAHSLLPFNLADFTLHVDTTTAGDGGVWLRAADTAAGIGVNGVLLAISPSTGALFFQVVQGGVYGPRFGQVALSAAAHTFEIAVSGNTYAVYVDGATTAATSLTSAVYASGEPGLYGNGPLGFDNFAVYDYLNPAAATTTVLTSGTNPSTYGQSVTFTATVSPAGATGSVTFLDSGVVIGTVALSAAGKAVFSTASLNANTHIISAAYGGDASFAGNTSNTVSQVVNLGGTSILISSSVNPSTFGQAVNFTATVTPNAATGQIAFQDNGVTLFTGNAVNGVATFTFNGLAAGSHPMRAVYLGDANNATSTSPVITQVVNQATSTTTLTSSVNPATAAQSTILTASVSPATATGKVTFYAGTAILGSGNVAGGLATLTTPFPSGTRPLFAIYTGDTSYLTSKSPVLSQSVTPIAARGFASPVTYARGGGFGLPAVGDFNGDGKADIVVVNFNDNNVSIFLGTGIGTFGAAVNYATGKNPISVAVSDFNRDGKQDLIVVNFGANTVSVLAGNGDGTFQAATTWNVGTTPESVTVSDFNGDGKADAAVANFSTNNVSILLGNGDGTFQPATAYATGAGPVFVMAGDFNGDGKADIVTANNTTNGISILTGNGDGTFSAPVAFSAGTTPLSAAIGDFNGDGIADIAVSNHASNDVTILLGIGNGTFQPGANYATGNGAAGIVAGDFDGDGKQDVVVANNTSATLSVFAGNGDGTLQAAVSVPAGVNSVRLAAGDFNADGRPDLVVANTGNVGIYLALAPSTTVLTSSANPSAFGQNVTLTATVSPVAATGTVTFQPGALNGNVANGIATVVINNPVGSISYTATYNGDSVFAASTSPALVQTVNPGAASSSTLVSSVNPSVFNQNVILTASVLPANATGTFTFKDGAVILGTPVIAGGSATLQTAGFTVGSHSLTAVYSGDASFPSSTTPILTQVVNRATTTTSLSSNLNPSVFGNSVTFSASPSPANATGLVTFKDGLTVLGSAVPGDGPASITIPNLTGGTHTITAVYGGDSNYLGSTSPAISQVVNKAQTSVTLVSSLNPSTFGQGIDLTASIAIASATGTVDFKEGATLLGSVNIVNGQATLHLASLAAGTHTISAVYNGDGNFLTATSVPLSQVVNQIASTTSLSAAPNPSVAGQAVTFTATVLPAAATGLVTFKDGATILGTGALAAGSAAFTISTLAVATHVITAVYAGDINDTGSTSGGVSQVVNNNNNNTSLTASPNPSVFGANVTLTATVTPAGATGNVTFKDGAAVLGTVALSGGGGVPLSVGLRSGTQSIHLAGVNPTATLTVNTFSAGSHPLTAVYGGDAVNPGSTSAIVTQVVSQISTITNLSSSANPSVSPQPLTLTAQVVPSSATGTVGFYDGAQFLGNGVLNGGNATLTLSTLAFGTHSLTAAYYGDAANAGSTSSVYQQTINLTAPVFSGITLPSGQVNQPYGPATFSATGGSGSFTFSFGGLPNGLTLSSAGVLGGTPTVVFSGTISVSVKDNTSNSTTTGNFPLTIALPALTLTGPINLGNVVVGTSVSSAYTAGGGKTPYTFALSGVPGVSVDGNGKVTGTAAQPGTFDITLVVTDAQSGSASLSLRLTVLGITTTSLPPATISADYSAAISVAGGIPPYSFSATGLPGGLSISNGQITGKPTTQGSSTVTVQVRDSTGLSVSAIYTLSVTGAAPLNTFTTNLSDAPVGQVYADTIAASGGTSPYTWTQTGGFLPDGLTLTSTGVLFGQPTIPGTYPLGVQVLDSRNIKKIGTVSIRVLPASLKITGGATLPSGIVSSEYPSQILSASGGVEPYSFGLKGILPPGLTLSNGQIAGTPTASGDFAFTLTVTDSAVPPSTGAIGVSVNIRPNVPDLILSAGSVAFTLASGTVSVPLPFAVSVTSSVVGQILKYSTVASAPWLTVTGPSSTPGTLSVSLNASALQLSSSGSPYSATVAVTCTSAVCLGKTQSFKVTLIVTAPPPQLTLGTRILTFSTLSTSTQSVSADLPVSNSGGGILSILSVTGADSWLSIGNFPTTLTAGASVPVSITASPANLARGYYVSSVTVKSTSGNITVPVTLLISDTATMTLGPQGIQLSLPEGSVPGNPTGSFLASLSGGGAVTFSAVVVPGAPWLTVTSTTGIASGATPGTVGFAVDPAAASALKAGAYYGTIRVTTSGIINSPQDFQVVLNVDKATALIRPTLTSAGLVFVTSGAGAIAPQTVNVFASSQTAVPYQASATTDDGGTWLSIGAAIGSASAGAPGQIPVNVSAAGLKAGVVYHGSVSVSFANSAVRTVNVTLIIQASGAGSAGFNTTGFTTTSFNTTSSRATPAAGPLCAGAQLVATQTGLVSNFSAPTSWPTPLAIKLLDTCGSTVPNGQIVTTFSNGDPPLALTLVDPVGGIYSGTWTPRRASAQVTVTASASAAGYPLVRSVIAGQVAPNTAPVLAPNATQDIFHPQVGAGLGPGNIVQIYGTGLASQIAQPLALPLPTTISGTQVFIGGVAAPLFYVSPGQIDAQIPFELTAGNQYQVVVSANGALTTPEPIQLNGGTPAALAFNSGSVVAQHADGTLILDSAPAKPGEFVVIYASGLGTTDVPVPSGTASPVNPLASVVNVPVLTLNDQPVKTLYSGLTPGFVGLYQINFQVPVDAVAGNYNLVLTQSGTVGNTTVLTVQP